MQMFTAVGGLSGNVQRWKKAKLQLAAFLAEHTTMGSGPHLIIAAERFSALENNIDLWH